MATNQRYKRSILIWVFVLCFLFLLQVKSHALSLVELNAHDRVLILAPHPDDELIGTGGIIQRAVEMKLPVKVVYLTSGENNELAFLVYKKHPVLGKSGLLKMGEVRRKESMDAMRFLGLQDSQLIFLGYPDFGTSEVFTKYWGNGKPFKSMLTRVSAVPYAGAFSYNAPYTGENVLYDFKKILWDFRPTKIFVTMPADTNGDHRAAYLFLQVALWDLEGKIPSSNVFPFIVHAAKWPVPRGFNPELSLDIPLKLLDAGVDWSVFDLSAQEILRKKTAVGFYKSQNAYNPRYLYTFVRKNELFGRLKDIDLKDNGIVVLNEDEEGQGIFGQLIGDESQFQSIIQSVTYAQNNHKLFIKITVSHWSSKFSGINLFLIGYRKGVNFSAMPKVRININFDRFFSVYERLNRVYIDGVKFSHDGRTLLIEFPLSALGSPDRILSSARTYIAKVPLEATPWRLLRVDGQ